MASPLETFVSNIQTLSAQGSYREICEMLTKSSDMLMKYSQHLSTVLETLDSQQHSLGVLAVLCVKLSATAPMPDTFETTFLQVQEFLSTCNGEQIRLAPDSFSELCHLLTKNLVELKTPIRGIAVLQKAIRKLQYVSSQLTPVHADICQLCLLAKTFKPALEFLDIDIVSIGQEGAGQFDSKYFLLYYYYGGMIYAAVKQFDRALFFFEVAITTPASAVSHIMLEAYKKYILISLIVHGKIMPLPKYTSQVVTRFIKPLSIAYHDLATAYVTNSASEVRAVLTKYHDLYVRDTNVGLTKQVLSSLFKKNIRLLTKVFLTLSLSDVAIRAQLSGPDQAVGYLINMIEAGEIFASINQKDGMVMFHDNPEKYNNPEMMKKLENEISICMDLNRKINRMEEEIVTNPQYVKKANSNQEEETSPSQGSKMSTYSAL